MQILVCMVVFTNLRSSDESLMDYVAILWVEVGQPCNRTTNDKILGIRKSQIEITTHTSMAACHDT